MSLFYDVGQSFYLGDTEFRNKRGDRTDYHFDLGELRSSAGIAVQWLSPMGLFRFSYAVPLRYQDETRREYGDDVEEIPVFGRKRILMHNGVHMYYEQSVLSRPDRLFALALALAPAAAAARRAAAIRRSACSI